MQTQSTTTEAARARRKWLIVDAEGQVLGRLASQIAAVLRGKHNVHYTAHNDNGDFVVVINAAKVRVTGRKETQKLYQHHTGWVGGVVTRTTAQLREHRAESIIELAVRRMLPKNVLGRAQGRKLEVYPGPEHPHQAQQPEPMRLGKVKV